MATKNLMGTLILDKVDFVRVHKTLEELGLSTEGTDLEVVKRLQDHQKKIPQRHLADCSVCGGASDTRLKCCPFCGEGDEEAQLETAVAENPNATIAPEDGGNGKGKRKRSAAVVDSPPAPTTPTRKAKPVKAEPVVLEPDAIVTTGGTALAPEGELDKNVDLIRQLQRETVTGYWKLGRAICENFSKRLFTLRAKADGTPKYKHFNQFVTAELGMSPTHAYRFMDVATLFTEEDVMTVGVSKLALVARVPEKDRDGLLQKIKSNNLSLQHVNDEVLAYLGGKRRNQDDTGRGRTRGAAAGVGAKEAQPRVTVGLVLGRQVVQLFRGGDPTKEARTLEHEPTGQEQMLNGVVTTYKLIKGETGLQLIITRKREDKPKAPSSKAPKPAKQGRPRKPKK